MQGRAAVTSSETSAGAFCTGPKSQSPTRSPGRRHEVARNTGILHIVGTRPGLRRRKCPSLACGQPKCSHTFEPRFMGNTQRVFFLSGQRYLVASYFPSIVLQRFPSWGEGLTRFGKADLGEREKALRTHACSCSSFLQKYTEYAYG